MSFQEDYQVTLDAFCGPLDLLLYLIRRAEVVIHDIPIAQITDQYLAFLKQVQEIDIDMAGEFLVMAATLVEIKSRTLAPPSEEHGVSDAAVPGESLDLTDPRYELVQQLLAYQKYRMACEELEARRIEFAQRFPRRPARADPAELRTEHDAPELELEDLHVYDLTEAYGRIMASIDFARMGDHRVEIDDTPIALHQEDLLDRLRRSPEHRMTLQEAFEGASAGQRIGLFLATLELVRLRRITVCQDEIESAIVLVLKEDAEVAATAEVDEAPAAGHSI